MIDSGKAQAPAENDPNAPLVIDNDLERKKKLLAEKLKARAAEKEEKEKQESQDNPK